MMNHIDLIKFEKYYDAEDKFFNEIVPILQDIRKVWDALDLDHLKVHPYGYAMPFSKIYNDMTDYLAFTSSSKAILVADMNGCIKILNSMIDKRNEPQVKICIIEGKHKGEIRTLPKSTADDFVTIEMAVYVKEGQ